MVLWHETPAARIGLRLCGAAVLVPAWMMARALYERVHPHPQVQANLIQLGLCAVFFVLLVVGGALLVVGPGLWRQVPLAQRWSGAMVGPRQFDLLRYPEDGVH